MLTEESQEYSDSDDELALPVPWRERHETLWFEDGNVILATPKIRFRVYRAFLSRHSTVFRDMFSMPQSATASDQGTMDGVPIVELHDDPEELGHFLSALHDRLYAMSSIFTLSHVLTLYIATTLTRSPQISRFSQGSYVSAPNIRSKDFGSSQSLNWLPYILIRLKNFKSVWRPTSISDWFSLKTTV